MKGIREVKQRIKSVKNTAQITRAMQLVASSKMKRAQDAATNGRPYALLMAEILGSLLEQVGEVEHPLIKEREVKKRGILVISTDKGLCGALNANLFRKLLEVDKATARFVTVGRKATQFITRSGRELMADFEVSDKVSFSEVRVVAEYLLKAYKEGQIDTIDIYYNRFVNTLKQEPTVLDLVPLNDLHEELDALRERFGMETVSHPDDQRELIFEPDARSLLNELPELYVKTTIYHRFLEARASEHSARMVAMKSATDNANNLVDDLTLEYNKARQAAITQEILELAAAGTQK